MKLTQVSGRIDGTWASDPWTGTINGTVDAQNFTGQMTLNSPGTFGTCSGTASVSGPAGGATVRWTSPGVSGNCTNLPIAIVINAQRR